MNRPKIGYKAVIRYNEFRWYILELEIPDDATIVHTGSGFYRTDKAVPRHFWPARTKTAIIDTSAYSWFDKEFCYTIGVTALSTLNPDHKNDCAAGIHFFETREQATNWGNANFGCLTAY